MRDLLLPRAKGGLWVIGVFVRTAKINFLIAFIETILKHQMR